MAELKIVEKRLDDIKPYEGNPRKNDKAVFAVKRSLEKFGFWNPIILNKDGVIIAGHTRFQAATEEGIETVPCIILSHLTDEEERAFRLADNRVSDFSRWDDNLLSHEMEAISADDWEAFGFSEKQMKQLVPPEKCKCPKCGREFTEL